MSDLGTRIMATGLVDDGIVVEAMERKLAQLRELVASNKPVCPHCKCEMTPVHFEGYYDELTYWQCNCVSLPDALSVKGAYA